MTTLSELPRRILSKRASFIWNFINNERQLSRLQNNNLIQLANIEVEHEGRFKSSIQVVFFNN